MEAMQAYHAYKLVTSKYLSVLNIYISRRLLTPTILLVQICHIYLLVTCMDKSLLQTCCSNWFVTPIQTGKERHLSIEDRKGKRSLSVETYYFIN